VRLRLAAAVVLGLTMIVPGVAGQDTRQPFADWLAGVRAEAVARGLRPDIVDAALASVEAPNEDVLTRDRAQPEQTRALEDYIASWVTPRNVATGREMTRRHATVLARVADAYGVKPPLLVAVWGLESSFGRIAGSQPTIAALATLAYDPRRAAFFRNELFEALAILDAGQIALEDMRGSWAGAMGQPQFMPSSYRTRAVDFDGDGRTDIWSSPPDIFASIANYLRGAGWVDGERWGREVRVSGTVRARVADAVPRRTSGCGAFRQMTEARPLADWTALGITLPGGGSLPQAEMEASLVLGESRSFLVYQNYLAILDYNCSNAYALSVGLLSDRLW